MKKIKTTEKNRIDKIIAKSLNISRQLAQSLIKEKKVFVNKVLVRKNNFVVAGDQEILITDILRKKINFEAKKIKIDIVYEDKDLAIINKKSGMVVHPAPGHYDDTLANALLYHFNSLSDANGQNRPGIIHRLDKDTSGLLIIAKNNLVHNALTEALKKRTIKRTYLAIVEGIVENKILHLNLPIGRSKSNPKKQEVKLLNSKEAITHVKVKRYLENNRTLVECQLETGRTHQIRVHLSYIKHPIVGDEVYGTKIDDFGQRLHAIKLEFVHPTTKKKMIFKKMPPRIFYKI